jgi:hypothetical protein
VKAQKIKIERRTSREGQNEESEPRDSRRDLTVFVPTLKNKKPIKNKSRKTEKNHTHPNARFSPVSASLPKAKQ